MHRTALFAIDIQHALALHPQTRIPHAHRVLTASNRVLDRVRALNDAAHASGEKPSLELVIVQHEEVRERGPLQRGSEAWEVVFAPRADDGCEVLVSKDMRNTFASNPSLASLLRSKGIDSIVAFGIQSECCVYATCLGALDLGFKVVLLRGAHSTYDADGKTAGEIESEVEERLVGRGVGVVEWGAWVEGL